MSILDVLLAFYAICFIENGHYCISEASWDLLDNTYVLVSVIILNFNSYLRMSILGYFMWFFSVFIRQVGML